MAFIAYHFKWDLGTIIELEHADRRRFIDEIADLNERSNAESLVT